MAIPSHEAGMKPPSTRRSTRSGRDEAVEPPERAAAGLTDEDVARRAYELFQMRGGEHGRDWGDWFQAERDLRASTGSARPEPAEGRQPRRPANEVAGRPRRRSTSSPRPEPAEGRSRRS